MSLQGGQQCWALSDFLAACPCTLFIDIISLFINWANKDACLLALSVCPSASSEWRLNGRTSRDFHHRVTLTHGLFRDQILYGKSHEIPLARAEARQWQEAQLSQRDRAMLHVIVYFAKSLNISQDHPVFRLHHFTAYRFFSELMCNGVPIGPYDKEIPQISPMYSVYTVHNFAGVCPSGTQILVSASWSWAFLSNSGASRHRDLVPWHYNSLTYLS